MRAITAPHCTLICVIFMIAHPSLYVTATDIHLTDLKYTTHPMLFFNSSDIATLQEKARSSHQKIAKLLQDATVTMISKPQYYLPALDYETFGGKWNEMYGNNLGALAMYCVLFPEDDEAFLFAVEYMDRLAALPKWQVISTPNDEVPVAHTLTGFTTAFDFLYPVLDPKRRMIYLRKILQVTKEFYFYAKRRSWGSFYLQNHVATNYLALMHGSLVVAVHYRPALFWLKEAVKKFERTMTLLNHIVDGSLDEGVPYGSYTSRSVTQYIYLVRRHIDIDHTKDFWIRQHFWYYYNTVMSNVQRTVGIGDSNNNWFYGPESQLVFLDNYVLRNGYGNWLANEIRKQRTKNTSEKLGPAQHQLWSTLHTEFVWFNDAIPNKAPSKYGQQDIHVFNDWGVVTFSTKSTNVRNDTFFAFKSGKLHGRAVFDVVQRGMYSSWVKGWRSFNPGHEHPDQNMFVFAPSGHLFITDGLYAPKFTYLNNVLTFSPSPTSRCFQPWEGQLGECDKYLRWTDPSTKRYGGELIGAILENGMVFTSGEVVEAYSSAMKLESVYRSLVLINPDILVILDHLKSKSTSPITHFSAFFHNLGTSFEQDKYKKFSGVKIPTSDGPMQMFWLNDRGESPKAELPKKSRDHTSNYQARETNYVNITMKMSSKTINRVAYVLLGPSATLKDIRFVDRRGTGTTLLVTTNQESYNVAIATTHSNPVSRQSYLGNPGFANVKLTNGTVIHFGVNSSQLIPYEDVNKSVTTARLSFSITPYFQCMFVLLWFALIVYRIKNKNRLRKSRRRVLLLINVCLTVFVIAIIGTSHGILTCESSPLTNALPSVVITSLPGSGAELIGWLFYYNPDLAYAEAPSYVVEVPRDGNFQMNPLADACYWTEEDLQEYPILTSWVEALFADLSTMLLSKKRNWETNFKKRCLQSETFNVRHLLQTEDDSPDVSGDILFKAFTQDDLLNHVKEHPGAQTVLHLTSGSWGLKLHWLYGILGHNMRAIHVIRDPRAWVANFLRNGHNLYQEFAVQQELSVMFKQSNRTCVPRGRYAKEYNPLWIELRKQSRGVQLHLQLAHLWEANTHAVLTNLMTLPATNARIVRYEDLVMDSQGSAEVVYDFIGYPLRPAMIHQLLQATHSGVYRTSYEGVISEETLTVWQQELTDEQIKDIETVCGELMDKLKYKKIMDS
ncbi:dermatan-sulfate epimerase-like protein [Amphiura filiformis]|uniref:dermatan-sulfate epimerase-like protein n=1 Tax=Amphiura filiformis TaxID=82378 RepID=UPI003B21AA98